MDTQVFMDRLTELRPLLKPVDINHTECGVMRLIPTTTQAALIPIIGWATLIIYHTISDSTLGIHRSIKELTSGRASRLDFLDIFRFFAILWVMMNHTGSEGRIDVLERQPSAVDFKSAVHNDPIFGALLGNSALGVEIFLVLSGLLAARSWLRNADQPFWEHFSSFIVRRLFRLAPSMFMLIYIAAGPIMMAVLPRFTSSMTSSCGFWGILSHITFTSNWQSTPTCMGYLWYLGLDTQLYILAPFFLHLLHKRAKIGGLLISLVVVFSCATRAIYCTSYDICNKSDVDIPFISYPGQDPESLQSIYSGLWDIYSRPQTKCGPFLIGIMLGFFTTTVKISLSPAHSKMIFRLCLMLAVATVYAILPEYWYPEAGTTTYNLIYTSCFRSFFALNIGGMIMALYYNQQSKPVHPIFCVLAKLTYNAYLVHMPVVYIFNWLPFLQTATSAYHLLIILPFVAFLSFLVATVFYLFVESPIGRLSSSLATKIGL